jgi:hypothetical protein
MPVYSITNKETGVVRLVDAPINSAALRHVASDVFVVAIPHAREVGHLVGKGVALETYVPAKGEAASGEVGET